MVQIEARDDGPAALLDDVEATLGVRPPMTFGGTAGGGFPRILWSGPRRWLVVEPERRDLFKTLREGISSQDAAVDLSSGRSAFRLSGLARGTSCQAGHVRRHPSRQAWLEPGCDDAALYRRRGTIADANATVPVYDLHAAWGHAVALWESLTDAAAEYGYAVDG